jgi:hypothetical protein
MILQMLRALVIVMAMSAGADARMLAHFDLAGLALQADAIVVAVRVGPVPGAGGQVETRYRVVRTIRGAAAPGQELDLYDSLYSLDQHAVEPEVVLFVARHDGKPYIVSSGMRVVERGKVFRFEQWSNPGGYVMVPQGHDPQDNWQAGVTPIAKADFDRELAAAIRRADALVAGKTERDPSRRRAQLLALLAAPGAAAPSTGFYEDAIANEVQHALADAGDLEGAAMASLRDRTFTDFGRSYGTTAGWLALAADATKPAELRATAIAMASRQSDYDANDAAIHATIALLADPAPAIRAAAIAAVAHAADVITSDAPEQAKINQLGRESRAAVTTRYAKESDPSVLYTIAEAYRDKPLGGRRGGPVVAAEARVERAMIDVSVRCLERGHAYAHAKVTATRAGAPVALRYNVSYSCGSAGEGTGGNGPDSAPPPGRYDLTFEAEVDHTHVTIPLGTLTSDGAELALAR